MWTKHDDKSFFRKNPATKRLSIRMSSWLIRETFRYFGLHWAPLPINSGRQPLHKLPSAPAAHVWKVNRRDDGYCFQNVQNVEKNVHLFEVSLLLLTCFVRRSSTFWNSRARWILRWNGKVGSAQFHTDLALKCWLDTGKACRLCARVSPEPRHEDAHFQGEWWAKRWRWEKEIGGHPKLKDRKKLTSNSWKDVLKDFFKYVQ